MKSLSSAATCALIRCMPLVSSPPARWRSDFRDLSASLPDLKAYLAVRESEPVYAAVREKGSLGIPCFVLEDGSVTLELEEVLG